jgi:hypothetical protein
MNTNQEIKDLVKSIKTHRRGKIPYHTNYWFTSGPIVKYEIRFKIQK